MWTAVNKHTPGVIAWVLGDRSSETFKLLWQIISCWHSYFYVITRGSAVYPCFINNEDHIVSKTYMTLVMCENSRFRHYLARLHRKTFLYSVVRGNAETIYPISNILSQTRFRSTAGAMRPQVWGDLRFAAALRYRVIHTSIMQRLKSVWIRWTVMQCLRFWYALWSACHTVSFLSLLAF